MHQLYHLLLGSIIQIIKLKHIEFFSKHPLLLDRMEVLKTPVNGNELFVTISPPVRNNKPEYLFQDDIVIINRIKLCSKKYIIYPELDSKGRLHYHLIMSLHDKVKWHKSVLPGFRKIGFVKIEWMKTFKDKLNVLQYIRKEWPDSSMVIGIKEPIYPLRRMKKKKNQNMILYYLPLDNILK